MKNLIKILIPVFLLGILISGCGKTEEIIPLKQVRFTTCGDSTWTIKFRIGEFGEWEEEVQTKCTIIREDVEIGTKVYLNGFCEYGTLYLAIAVNDTTKARIEIPPGKTIPALCATVE